MEHTVTHRSSVAKLAVVSLEVGVAELTWEVVKAQISLVFVSTP